MWGYIRFRGGEYMLHSISIPCRVPIMGMQVAKQVPFIHAQSTSGLPIYNFPFTIYHDPLGSWCTCCPSCNSLSYSHEKGDLVHCTPMHAYELCRLLARHCHAPRASDDNLMTILSRPLLLTLSLVISRKNKLPILHSSWTEKRKKRNWRRFWTFRTNDGLFTGQCLYWQSSLWSCRKFLHILLTILKFKTHFGIEFLAVCKVNDPVIVSVPVIVILLLKFDKVLNLSILQQLIVRLSTRRNPSLQFLLNYVSILGKMCDCKNFSLKHILL